MTADTTSVLEVLRDMKNLRERKVNESGQIRVYHRKSTKPQKVVDDLDSTEDREASEKAHGAPYQTQLGLHSHLQILS